MDYLGTPMNRSVYFFTAVLLAIATFFGGVAVAQEASTAPSAGQAGALVEVLRDKTARDALIAELERIAAEGADKTALSEPETATQSGIPAKPQISFGRRLALLTQETAESITDAINTLGERLSAIPNVFAALGGAENSRVLFDALKNLALIIIATYAVFLLLRVGGKRLYQRLGETASDAGQARTFGLVTASAVIDAMIVVVAWGAGYAIALTFFGEFGRIGIRQTMYLNAFLVVELAKVVLRVILSPSAGELRLIALTDGAARYLNRWLTVIISILGYGELLVIPIINQNVSFLAGRAVSTLIALIALVIALVLVLRNRRRVAGWLTDEESHADQRGLLSFLALRWHWPVVLYLTALFVIVVTRPGGMLFPILGASGKILLAILIGMIVTGAISRAASRGVSLPDQVRARLPLLETRLNRFVPPTLLIIRLFAFVAVAAFAANVVGLIDLQAWLESRVGVEMTATIFSTAMIVLVSFVIWLGLTSWIDYRLNPEYGNIPTAREKTLLALLRNAATIAILIITLMFALSEMGIDIAPLLASAGVLGLAIGFGAQKLVQDIITGIFIQFESAINVGDVVTVGGTLGTVERLTIRSVSLRDLQGAYHIIPFSSVSMVTNYMRDFAYFVCDIGVAYRENTDEVRDAMMDAFEELAMNEEIARDFLGPMEWMGVTSFGDNAVNVRTRLKTKPGTQWAIGRAYNAIVKKMFDERGIEMPFPHRTIYFGQNKDGGAAPARFSVEDVASSAIDALPEKST